MMLDSELEFQLGSSFELGNFREIRERKTGGHCRCSRKDSIIPFIMSLWSYLRSMGRRLKYVVQIERC